MDSRYPTSDIQHLRNHRYDPAALASEQTWAREVIETWVASCEDDVVTAVAKALPDASITGIGTTLRDDRPIGAKAIRVITLRHSQTDVTREHIEDSVQTWRVDTDLTARLNCPYCKEAGTNAHYMHFLQRARSRGCARKYFLRRYTRGN